MVVIIFYLDVVSVEKKLFFGLVEMFQVTGSEGELGIFYGYILLLIVIKFGMVCIVKLYGYEEYIYVLGGIVEVQLGIVIVLVDIVICGEDLDVVKVEEVKCCVEECIFNQYGDMDFV